MILTLVLLDFVTKAYGSTPDWGWHHTDPKSMLTVAAGFPFLFWSVTRWPMVLAVAGALSNTLNSFSPRGVANPFVASSDGGLVDRSVVHSVSFLSHGHDTGTMAYNLADLCITLGAVLLLASFVVWAVRLVRQTEFEGVVRRA